MMDFLKGKTESKPEYMVALLLKQEEGMAFVLEVFEENKTVRLMDQKAFKYSNAWDSLIYDVDEILFGFETTHKIQLKKTLFFVYSHLVDGTTGELKETYLTALQSVIEENDLDSIGYFELDELLARSYAQKEHEGLSALLVEIDTPAVSACIYQGGKRIFSETVAKTQDLVADLEEIFAHMDESKKLPPRVIMYDSTDLESESHRILMHKWKAEQFQHAPKVEVVKEDQLRHAFEQGIREQLFGSIADTTPITMGTPVEDVQDSEPDEPTEAEVDVTPSKPSQGQSSVMGFVIGGDVAESSVQEPSRPSEAVYTMSEPSYATVPHAEPAKSLAMPRILNMTKLKNVVSSLGMKLRGKGKLAIIGRGLLVVCIVLGGLALYFNHSADVTVEYTQASIQKDIDMSQGDSLKESKKSFTAQASTATTGQKDIGEKAKGEVTIYSADDKEKTIKKGTKFTTDDGIAFTLDADVTTKAASKTITGDGDIMTSTSKTQATLTAVELGPKSNIKKDTKLTIADLSSTTYFAKVSKAFLGGTQKTIETASKEDLAKLDADVEKQLKKKSAEELAKVSSDQKIIEALTEVDITKQTYSKELGEEADSVQETATADVKYFAYNEQDLKESVIDKIQSDVPDGYVVDAKDVSVSIASAKRDKKTNKISIKVTVEAKPELKLDTSALASDIKGKSLDDMQQFEEKYKAQKITADIHTFMPFLSSRLPYFTSHMNITLKPVEE